jgi:pimeloyl-ACP methyl ester carboxylesterase
LTANFARIDAAALALWRAAGQHIDTALGAAFYRAAIAGRDDQRPWLLLIHGFPTASLDWWPLWAVLARDFRLLAPDLLGFGYSPKPHSAEHPIAIQADLCESLLRAVGATQVHLLAHDYGVTVAQELLARDRERAAHGEAALVASVALLNGGLFPETHRARLIQKLLLTPLGPLLSRLMSERSFARSFSAVFGPKTQPTRDELAVFWQLITQADGHRIAHRLILYVRERRVHRERWVGALVASRVPIRLINGALDPVSGAHMVKRFRELIAQPDIVSLDDIGHYPQVEAPQRVYAALRAFWLRNGTIRDAA